MPIMIILKKKKNFDKRESYSNYRRIKLRYRVGETRTENIADTVFYTVSQPDSLNVTELLIKPTGKS